MLTEIKEKQFSCIFIDYYKVATENNNNERNYSLKSKLHKPGRNSLCYFKKCIACIDFWQSKQANNCIIYN